MCENSIEYNKILAELKGSVDVLLEGFYDVNKNLSELKNTNKKNKFDISREFSVINIPSKGIFYKDKPKRIFIRYLTAVEENILSDSFLVSSGKGIEFVLNNLIMNEEIEAKELILSDFQAILIFLRSTAYGDAVEVKLTCPHCSVESEFSFKLSALEFKEQTIFPDEKGLYHLEIKGERNNLDIVLKAVTFGDELKKVEAEESDEGIIVSYNDDGDVIKVRRNSALKIVSHLVSINDITDKEQIEKIVSKMSIKYTNQILKAIDNIDVGVRETIEFECPSCREDSKHKIRIGHDFISLPEKYKETIKEENFLITYYGKGITRADVMLMPSYERKWHIRRIKKEMDKKHKAEESAVNKSKGTSTRSR